MRCAVEEEEEHIIAHFLGALQPEIAEVVHLQQYWTYADVCRLVFKVEKQIKSRGRLTTNRFSSISRTPVTQNAKTSAPKIEAGPGTSTNSSNQQLNQHVIRYFKCRGLGHLARECPNKQLITLVEDPAIYDTTN